MPVKCEGQLEKCIDDAAKKHDFQALEQFLETDFSDDISHKCSKQFLNKVDKLMCQGLKNEEVGNMSTLLNILQKHGRNINILGNVGFPAMIVYGLVQKMVNWFEKTREILQNQLNEKNDQFTILMEDFFDVLMIVHDTNSEGKIQILENFILRICALATDKKISIYIQQEAVRRLNTMLGSMPRDTRKKIISTKEMLHIMNDMAKRILDAGDYDLQVAITEALCRITSEKQRGELASQWFTMEFVISAFKRIKDSEFETDCRKFLNQVNAMLGDKRRVFTYPCLSAILGIHELQVPMDDHLEEFWIDFNLGSKSISFYIAADEEDHQWETVSIPEEEVEKYIVEDKDKKTLTIYLKNPMTVNNQSGEKIILQFDSSLEIMDAAAKVYGANKYEGFSRKNTMSVAKTTVHVIFDESGSQVLVPESQVSPLKEKNCKPLKDKSNFLQPQYLPIENNLNKKVDKVDFPTVQSKIFPGKRKVSEASMSVPCIGRLSRQSPLLPTNASTPRKERVKIPLQMMNTAEKMDSFPICEGTKNFSIVNDNVSASALHKSLKNKYIHVGKVIKTTHDDLNMSEIHKLDNIVPDSQPTERNDIPLLPGILETSVAEIKTQKRQTCWVPETIITHCNKQYVSAPGATILSNRSAKQKAFSSIFETTSPVLRGQQCSNGEIQEQQQKEINKIPVKSDKRNSAESQNSFMHLDEKISKNNSTKIVPSKSDTAVSANRMNDSSVNLKHSKLVTGTSDEDHLDVLSSEKETTKKKTGQKGKSKEMIEAAKTLISKISDRYKQKDVVKSAQNLCQSFSNGSTSLNKSYFSDSKRKSQKRSSRNLKTTTLLNVTTGQLMDDVYNFNISGFDEPTIKLGIQEFHATKLKVTTNLKKMDDENDGKSTRQKKQDKKNRTNKNKQHLFSDTDTEYRGDDTKTDISWLRESSRKPKPQLIDYGRSRKPKKLKTLKTYKSPVSNSKETSQQKKKTNKPIPIPKIQIVNKAEKAENNPQPVRVKQPRRAALTKKSYKEVSDSETDSAEETSIMKNTLKEHVRSIFPSPEHKNIKNKLVNQLKVQQGIVSSEITKGKRGNQEKNTASKVDMQKRKIELSPMASSESAASVEIMRNSEKSIDEESIQECISVRQSPLSSFGELTPEKEGTINHIEKISPIIKMNKESVELKQPFEKGKKAMAKNKSFSPILSPLSLPNFTSFSPNKTFASEHDDEVPDPEDKIYDAEETASIRNYPLDRSSDTELKGSENLMKNKEVSKSSSQLSTTSRSREDLWHESPLIQIHESGPTKQSNIKRLYQNDTGSDSDEVEIKKKESKRKLLPRKLFKADDSIHKVSESISTLSVNDTTVFDGEGWDADNSSVGMICQNLHKGFARKIQCRSKRMENFTKQSLKTAHHHMNTIRTELHEHRTKRLQDFHACIIKELENFEKDSLTLKNTEKECTNILKKHFQIYTTYRESEQQRLQNIKTAFEKNIYYTPSCEENILTSEMHLMKEDMKRFEEKLLKEMHEEELQNVRKALQSLFLPEDR